MSLTNIYLFFYNNKNRTVLIFLKFFNPDNVQHIYVHFNYYVWTN